MKNSMPTRRDLLGSAAMGLGAIALADLLSQDGLLADDRLSIDPAKPFAARLPHAEPKAKRVLMVFCAGA